MAAPEPSPKKTRIGLGSLANTPKRPRRTLSDESDDGMNFNQGASSAEPAPKRDLETEESQLLSLADAN